MIRHTEMFYGAIVIGKGQPFAEFLVGFWVFPVASALWVCGVPENCPGTEGLQRPLPEALRWYWAGDSMSCGACCVPTLASCHSPPLKCPWRVAGLSAAWDRGGRFNLPCHDSKSQARQAAGP